MVDSTLEGEAVSALSERYANGELSIDEFEAALDRLGERDDDPDADDVLENDGDTDTDDGSGGGESTADSSESGGGGWTPGRLLALDESDARERLSDAQFERYRKLHELDEQGEETKFQWQEESRRVQELTVSADMDQLGTEVDLFGNDVLVHLDSGNREFQRAADRLETHRSDVDDDSEVVELDAETRADIADALQDMLDAVLVRWDGTRWSTIPEDQRGAVLADCRDKWGVDGLLLAWVKIGAAVDEQRGEWEELIDSFR